MAERERPSVPKRLYETVKEGLSSLFEDRALAEFSDDEIAAELKRREERKAREDDERRVREREELEALRRAAARRTAEAEERAKERSAGKTSATRPSSSSSSTSTSTTSSSRSNFKSGASARSGGQSQRKEHTPPPKPGAGLDAKRLREIYATLEVKPGATYDEVKSSYRRLMRKYHPDLHINDPKKHKAATALTMQLTEAYRQLEAHLKK